MSDPTMLSVIDLPLASVGRIVKTGLPNGSKAYSDPGYTKLSKEVKIAMSRAGGLFALYLANSAIESAKSHHRQTVSGEDVIAALEEIEFEPLIEPCMTFLKQGKKVRVRSQSDKGDKGDKEGTKSTSKKSSSSKQSTKAPANPRKRAPAKRKAPAGESTTSKKKKVEPVEEIENDDFEPVNEHADEAVDEQDEEDEINDD